MGNSLHNKIYLGRSPLLHSRRIQGALAVLACMGVGLGYLVLRTL